MKIIMVCQGPGLKISGKPVEKSLGTQGIWSKVKDKVVKDVRFLSMSIICVIDVSLMKSVYYNK